MDIDRIRECVDLSKTLSFTQTSKNLFITQSVLSKHVSALERELGFPIFKRTKRSVALTPLGKIFVEGSIPIVAAYDAMIDQVHTAKDQLPTALRIGYLRGAIGSSIPLIQSIFATHYPDIDVDYITYEFCDLDEALASDAIDIAVGKLSKQSALSSYDYEVLFEDCYFAACDLRHPLSEKPSVAPSDFRGLTVALPASSFYTDDSETITAYLQPEAHQITIKHNVRDINSLPILAQSRDWIGITFGHLAHLYNDELALIPLEGLDLSVSFAVVWKKERTNEAVRKWASIARAALAHQGRA